MMQIPNSVLAHHIFHYISSNDLLVYRTVSKTWNSCAVDCLRNRCLKVIAKFFEEICIEFKQDDQRMILKSATIPDLENNAEKVLDSVRNRIFGCSDSVNDLKFLKAAIDSTKSVIPKNLVYTKIIYTHEKRIPRRLIGEREPLGTVGTDPNPITYSDEEALKGALGYILQFNIEGRDLRNDCIHSGILHVGYLCEFAWEVSHGIPTCWIKVLLSRSNANHFHYIDAADDSVFDVEIAMSVFRKKQPLKIPIARRAFLESYHYKGKMRIIQKPEWLTEVIHDEIYSIVGIIEFPSNFILDW